MGCTSCGGSRNINNNLSIKSGYSAGSSYSPEDCNYTKEVLEKWKSLLICVQINNKAALINTTQAKINSYLGYVQSALNYPDNYCYYKDKLSEFETTLLPRILLNVPNCNNY